MAALLCMLCACGGSSTSPHWVIQQFTVMPGQIEPGGLVEIKVDGHYYEAPGSLSLGRLNPLVIAVSNGEIYYTEQEAINNEDNPPATTYAAQVREELTDRGMECVVMESRKATLFLRAPSAEQTVTVTLTTFYAARDSQNPRYPYPLLTEMVRVE